MNEILLTILGVICVLAIYLKGHRDGVEDAWREFKDGQWRV